VHRGRTSAGQIWCRGSDPIRVLARPAQHVHRGVSKRVTPDAPECSYHRRRYTEHDQRTRCPGSSGSASLPGLTYRSGGEVPLRIYPGGIKTRVTRLHKAYVATAEGGCTNPWLSGAPQSSKAAWHEVPGKREKDASSPLGTVANVSFSFPKCIGGVADHVHLLLSLYDFP
jgi:hypothetical protein